MIVGQPACHSVWLVVVYYLGPNGSSSGALSSICDDALTHWQWLTRSDNVSLSLNCKLWSLPPLGYCQPDQIFSPSYEHFLIFTCSCKLNFTSKSNNTKSLRSWAKLEKLSIHVHCWKGCFGGFGHSITSITDLLPTYLIQCHLLSRHSNWNWKELMLKLRLNNNSDKIFNDTIKN